MNTLHWKLSYLIKVHSYKPSFPDVDHIIYNLYHSYEPLWHIVFFYS